jgi:endonuclease I
MKSFLTSLLALFLNSVFLYGQIPSGYYDTAQGKTGYALKTELSHIISDGYVSYSYNDLYDIYVTSDADNYYENNGSVLDIYSENPNGGDPYEYTQIDDKCSTYTSEGSCYNREHIMPQSVFNSESPMKSDAHFVVPVDGYVNGRRSNYPFGEVSNPTWTSMNGSKLGPNTTAGYSGTVFEPIDEFKGDIARMLFYFATRYEDRVSAWSHDMLNGTSDQVFSDWFLAILLDWHRQDPVSQKEIDRNNAIYEYQKNRNPFIDHPEWVDSIWGQDNSGGGVPPADAQVIRIMDFDGSSPSWDFTNNISFFDNGTDGFFGIHDANNNATDGIPYDTGIAPSSEVSVINYSDITGDFLFINDLDDEGDHGTTGEAVLNFEAIDISNYNQVSVQFDYDISGFDSSDYIKYQLFEDGTGKGLKLLNKNGEGNIIESVTEGTQNLSLSIYIKQNGASDHAGIDNIKIIGVSIQDNTPVCDNLINSYPYSQGFENTLGLWTQSQEDDFDWTINSGGTPSSNTGPSSAAEGTYYIYMESSNPNYSNKKAIIESPCFDLTSLSSPEVSFNYHMYGDADKMGFLNLEITTDNGQNWSTVWSKSGNQGDQWYTAEVDLSNYEGSTIRMRFYGETGTTWQGDMAIDNLKILSKSIEDISLSLTIQFDQYPEETSWDIKDNQGNIIYSGGPYSDQPKESILTIPLTLSNDCYVFTIKDSYGDGICCNYGNGYYNITKDSTGEILISGGSFSYEENKDLCLDNTFSRPGVQNKCTVQEIIYPNPVNDLIYIRLNDLKLQDYIIFDTTGKPVQQGKLTDKMIKVNVLSKGVYFIKIYNSKKYIIRKFVKI